MHAVVLSEFGSPAMLEFVDDRPEPVPGPGQALVRVAYAGITFVETQVRAGRPPNPAMAPALPAVLGNGVGGVVAAVGPDVDTSLVGTRVVAAAGGRGGYAEWCAVPVSGLVPVPEALELDAALALLADGRTAMALTDAVEPKPGETVLVEAAAGGVGSLLVQLAARAGARVVALAGGERKLALARELGAEIAIDYLRPDWAAAVAAQAGSVDVVYDGVGGEVGRAAFDLLAAAGRYAGFGIAGGSFADIPPGHRPEVARVGVGAVTPERSAQLTRRALDLAAAGALRPVIGQLFPLDQAAAAHAAIEARATLGKTLLVVGADLDPAQAEEA